MAHEVKQVVIVGGGTAGWITACLLAARHDGLEITLIESPEIPTIGVGEGSWPTLRKTLQQIGVSETEFLANCDASFKQGSRFDGWVTGAPIDSYQHPFALTVNGSPRDIHRAWKSSAIDKVFASAVSPQPDVCAQNLAPKQKTMPDYAGALNYGYHLDAVKLAALLTRHATTRLGINHIKDHVTEVMSASNGDISAVKTKANGNVSGDLFVDCTGQASVLLGQHFGIEFIDHSQTLPNDRALTAHLPYPEPDAPIASQTISTAHAAGWIWDIGLPTRRGVGCVYASTHCSDDEAETILKTYITENSNADITEVSFRKLSFQSGHRAEFWHRNCVAIGLSAGFLEPLEASAIVLVELSAESLAENFPANRDIMDILASRFNDLFLYRWGRIIDFLKLHYVLSERSDPYWQLHRNPETIPTRLQHLMTLWKHQPPSQSDLGHVDEVFPAASYQYVLYGMGYETNTDVSVKPLAIDAVLQNMNKISQQTRKFTAGLPTNRALLSIIKNQYEDRASKTGKFG